MPTDVALSLEQFAKDAETGQMQASLLIAAPLVVASGQRRSVRWRHLAPARSRVTHDRRQNFVDFVVKQSRDFEELTATLRTQLLALCNDRQTALFVVSKT